jgi:alkanesulfonate monooxygenase SsuD/methylene tetrahydromethanopterin reductase-like flavin-dependent oxidoreductase (luciferase family)
MKQLWTQDTVAYDGEFYDIPPVQLFGNPVSAPHPPVFIGAQASERTFAEQEVGDALHRLPEAVL